VAVVRVAESWGQDRAAEDFNSIGLKASLGAPGISQNSDSGYLALSSTAQLQANLPPSSA
jgi:hypothetical protein